MNKNGKVPESGLKNKYMDAVAFFRKNFDILNAQGVFYAENPEKTREDILNKITPENSRICADLLSGKINTIEINGITFHSRRDPEKEARIQLDSLKSKNARHIILIGGGLGYLVKEAIRDPDVESILLVEALPEVFYYFVSLFSPDSLAPGKLKILYAGNLDEAGLENILPFLRGKNTSEILIHTHHPSFAAAESVVGHLNLRIRKLMEKRSINQATIIKFQNAWNRNIAANLREIIRGGKKKKITAWLKDNFPDKDIVIAGAGPSLFYSMEFLKKYRGHFLLFVADTAFIPLARSGVIPDITFASDPQVVNAFFAHHKKAAQSVWMLDPVVISAMPHFLHKTGANLFWWNNDFYMDAMIREYFGERGGISHGGSVSTNAFSLATEINPPRIILIGQDLSFTGKTAHVRGAALEDRIFYTRTRTFTMENHNFSQLWALPKEPVPSLKKTSGLFTNAKMKVFIEWFTVTGQEHLRKNPSAEILNATADGVFLKNFQHKTLEEIYGENTAEISATRPLAESMDIPMLISPEPDGHRGLAGHLKSILKGLENLQDLYKENISLTRKIIRKSNPEWIRHLNSNDARIATYARENSILSISAQSSILQITENPELSGHNQWENSLKLYEALAHSAARTIQLFRKCVRMMD